MPRPDDKELSDLEGALARLQPSPAGFDRDRLMFESGRAAARRRWLWPATTGVMTAVAAGLAAVLVLRADPAPVVRVVYVERTAPAPSPEPPAEPVPSLSVPEPVPDPLPAVPLSYGRLQEFVIRYGIEELPESGPTAGTRGPATAVSTAWQWHSRPASSWLNEGVE